MATYKFRNIDTLEFEQIFDRYNRLLYVLAFRYLKSEEEAEDAVQYSFMKLWEERESIDDEQNVKSLLVTILKNHVLNELRHRNIVFEKNYEIAQTEENEEAQFIDNVEESDFRQKLINVIMQLPQQKKEVCLLKIEKGLTNQEIAEKMNISVPTVKSHYTQAIKMLRISIGKLMWLILLFN